MRGFRSRAVLSAINKPDLRALKTKQEIVVKLGVNNGPNYLVKENLDLLPNLNKIKKINFYNQSSLSASG